MPALPLLLGCIKAVKVYKAWEMDLEVCPQIWESSEEQVDLSECLFANLLDSLQDLWVPYFNYNLYLILIWSGVRQLEYEPGKNPQFRIPPPTDPKIKRKH